MFLKIPRLYDSHVHWLATGEYLSGLRLNELSSAIDIRTLEVKKNYFRGEWLTGFGWDENNWSNKELPTKEILDEVFPDTPVIFQRADGHSSWCNTQALKKLNILNNQSYIQKYNQFIKTDSNGEPTGVLTETAHVQALEKVPSLNLEQTKVALKFATKIFNQAGFTHIRDMTSSMLQWQAAVELEKNDELTLCVDSYFVIEKLEDLDTLIENVNHLKKNQTKYLRAKGIKVFFDGSLGSETALLSQPYQNTGKSSGVLCWSIEAVAEIIRRTWSHGLEVAIHTIGDQAAHLVAEKARAISAQGVLGKLNLEHVQVMRPETIQLLKPLHVHCYMQPCHYLSDRVWLKDKLGALYKHAFPWQRIYNAKIPLNFGSDSPIEPTSIFNNFKAMDLANAEGVEAIKFDVKNYSHPDHSFTQSFTTINNGKIEEVNFDGKALEI